MSNAFGEAASQELQIRYESRLNSQSTMPRAPVEIRKTRAQVQADNAVKQKLVKEEPRELFKLNRFKQVSPRTSTKRGDQAFMSKQSPRTSAD